METPADPNGYTATGVTLRMLVQEAYGVYDDKLLSGGPAWIDSDKFDIEAKFDVTEIPKWNSLTYRQRANMLQPLLAERFNVKVHHEMKPFLFIISSSRRVAQNSSRRDRDSVTTWELG